MCVAKKLISMLRSYQIYCHILMQSNIYDKCWKIIWLSFLKRTFKLIWDKNYINKHRDIIDSRRCYNVMKTHRTKLRVDMNNKDKIIMHYADFLHFSKYFFHYHLHFFLLSNYMFQITVCVYTNSYVTYSDIRIRYKDPSLKGPAVYKDRFFFLYTFLSK